VYAWLDGDTDRSHHAVTAEELADRLDAVGAAVVRDAARSFRDQTDADYYADNLRLIEPAYLRGTTPQSGSGFGGDAARWRARRELVVDGLHRSGTFLELGCATLVEPDGRLLASHYLGHGVTDRTAEEHLRDLGFEPAGSSRTGGATTAWLAT